MEAVGPNTDWISLFQCITLLAIAPGFVRMVFRTVKEPQPTLASCETTTRKSYRVTVEG